jgi:hypothetical protein
MPTQGMASSTSVAPTAAHISASAMVEALNFVMPSLTCIAMISAALVRLHMRTQALGIARDLEHELKIVLDAAAKEEQRRRRDVGFVFDVEPGV